MEKELAALKIKLIDNERIIETLKKEISSLKNDISELERKNKKLESSIVVLVLEKQELNEKMNAFSRCWGNDQTRLYPTAKAYDKIVNSEDEEGGEE